VTHQGRKAYSVESAMMARWRAAHSQDGTSALSTALGPTDASSSGAGRERPMAALTIAQMGVTPRHTVRKM